MLPNLCEIHSCRGDTSKEWTVGSSVTGSTWARDSICGRHVSQEEFVMANHVECEPGPLARALADGIVDVFTKTVDSLRLYYQQNIEQRIELVEAIAALIERVGKRQPIVRLQTLTTLLHQHLGPIYGESRSWEEIPAGVQRGLLDAVRTSIEADTKGCVRILPDDDAISLRIS